MNRPLTTLHLKKQNFKTRPFRIEIEMNGWLIGTFWTVRARLRKFSTNGIPRWQLRDKRLDVFIHADQLVFDKEKK